MKVLNFGSLNIDYVYNVDHITKGGETQQSYKLETFPGGKGLNQSIALTRAGIEVFHAGIIGEDGTFLFDTCKENGISTTFLKQVPEKNGHAIIQVDKNAQNCILLYKGTNGRVDKAFVDFVLSSFEKGDVIVLQNEINLIDYIIDKAYEKSMTIILNPSPFNKDLFKCDLSKVSIFIMNEIEGAQIYGSEANPEEILKFMREKYPKSKVVLTLGTEGSFFSFNDEKYFQPIFEAKAVDTTAAGDTFTGYFVKGLIEDYKIDKTMKIAACASSIAVSRHGATTSIPLFNEVIEELENKN
ncbi:MAG: ribokinase [Lachnospirales bacterium]